MEQSAAFVVQRGDLSCKKRVVHIHFHYKLSTLLQPGDLSCNENLVHFHLNIHSHLEDVSHFFGSRKKQKDWFTYNVIVTCFHFNLSLVPCVGHFVWIFSHSSLSALSLVHFYFPYHFDFTLVCKTFWLIFFAIVPSRHSRLVPFTFSLSLSTSLCFVSYVWDILVGFLAIVPSLHSRLITFTF